MTFGNNEPPRPEYNQATHGTVDATVEFEIILLNIRRKTVGATGRAGNVLGKFGLDTFLIIIKPLPMLGN